MSKRIISLALVVAAGCKAKEQQITPPAPTKPKPAEVTTEVRFVGATETVEFVSCDDVRRGRRRHSLGTRLVVEVPVIGVATKRLKRVVGGGCVLVRDLVDTPPKVGTEMARTRAAMLEGSLLEAGRFAHRAELLAPDTRASLDIQRAIYDTLGDIEAAKRVYRALKRFPKEKQKGSSTESSPPPFDVTLKHAYVAASHLNVRAKPSSDGRVVDSVGLNDRVKILAVDDAWANVELPIRAGVLVLDEEMAVTLDWNQEWTAKEEKASKISSAAPAVVGFVATRFLTTAPLTVEEMDREAKERIARDDIEGALVYLERAAILAPRDEARRQRLIAMAFDAGRYGVAAWAANLSRQNVAVGSMEIRAAFGCRPQADPTGRWDVYGDAQSETACIYGVDIDPVCEPQYETEPSELEFGDDDELEKALVEWNATGHAEADKANANLKADYTAKAEKRDAIIDGFASVYSKPTVVAAIRSHSNEGAIGSSLYVYRHATLEPVGCYEDIFNGKVTIYAVPIVPPGDGELTVIIQDTARWDMVYGIVEAPDAKSAYEQVRGPDRDPYAPLIRPGVSTRLPNTHCPVPCGC